MSGQNVVSSRIQRWDNRTLSCTTRHVILKRENSISVADSNFSVHLMKGIAGGDTGVQTSRRCENLSTETQKHQGHRMASCSYISFHSNCVCPEVIYKREKIIMVQQLTEWLAKLT